VRNIAEGAGRWSKLYMSKHYKIARGEAMECAASLDALKVRRLIEQPRYEDDKVAFGKHRREMALSSRRSRVDVIASVIVAALVNDAGGLRSERAFLQQQVQMGRPRPVDRGKLGLPRAQL